MKSSCLRQTLQNRYVPFRILWPEAPIIMGQGSLGCLNRESHAQDEGYGRLSEKYISMGRQVLSFPPDCVKLHDEEGWSVSGIQTVVINKTNNQLNVEEERDKEES